MIMTIYLIFDIDCDRDADPDTDVISRPYRMYASPQRPILARSRVSSSLMPSETIPRKTFPFSPVLLQQPCVHATSFLPMAQPGSISMRVPILRLLSGLLIIIRQSSNPDVSKENRIAMILQRQRQFGIMRRILVNRQQCRRPAYLLPIVYEHFIPEHSKERG